MISNDEQIIQKALRQNEFIHKYVMAIDHALLWIAALSFAAFFHLSPSFNEAEALLLSTLVAYGAYLCESGLGTLKLRLLNRHIALTSEKPECGIGFALISQ